MNIVKLVNEIFANHESTTFEGMILISKDDLTNEIVNHLNESIQARQVKQVNKYIDPVLVKDVLGKAQGRFLGITVEKKDGSERTFNFKPNIDNPPSFKYHNELVSIYETGKGNKSFNINKVKELKFNGQILKAV